MRPVFLQGAPMGTPEQKLQWLEDAVRNLAGASTDQNPVDIASEYTITGTLTPTRSIDVTTPTAANIAAVLATLISDLQKGGSTRTT